MKNEIKDLKNLDISETVLDIKPNTALDLEQITLVLEAMEQSGKAHMEDWAQANTAYRLLTEEIGPFVPDSKAAEMRRDLMRDSVTDILEHDHRYSEKIRDASLEDYKSRAFTSENITEYMNSEEHNTKVEKIYQAQDRFVSDNKLEEYIKPDADMHERRLKGLDELIEVADYFNAPNVEQLRDYRLAYEEALENDDTHAIDYMDAEMNDIHRQAMTLDTRNISSIATELKSTSNNFVIEGRYENGGGGGGGGAAGGAGDIGEAGNASSASNSKNEQKRDISPIAVTIQETTPNTQLNFE